MVNETEIRINNLIRIGVNVAQIRGIHTQTIAGSNEKAHFYVRGYPNNKSKYWPVYSIEVDPIPLTEEWLLKFGYKRIDDPRQTRIWWKNKKGEDIQEVSKDNYFCYRPIKHVHQLQNLYFALTGEELTIKEV